MAILLLDTNIVSYYQRNDSRAKAYNRYIIGLEAVKQLQVITATVAP